MLNNQLCPNSSRAYSKKFSGQILHARALKWRQAPCRPSAPSLEWSKYLHVIETKRISRRSTGQTVDDGVKISLNISCVVAAPRLFASVMCALPLINAARWNTDEFLPPKAHSSRVYPTAPRPVHQGRVWSHCAHCRHRRRKKRLTKHFYLHLNQNEKIKSPLCCQTAYETISSVYTPPPFFF